MSGEAGQQELSAGVADHGQGAHVNQGPGVVEAGQTDLLGFGEDLGPALD